jgi:hypothetical protein
VDRFPQVIDNVYSMILVIGEETLKLPEHTDWLPAEAPDQPEEPEGPQLPAEPEDPVRPPDAELPVEPTPPTVTEGAGDTAEGASGGVPAEIGEKAPDEETNEEKEKAEHADDTEQTEG